MISSTTKVMEYKAAHDKKICISLLSPLVVLMVQTFLLYYFSIIDTPTGARVQLLSKIIVGIFFVYSLPVVIKRSSSLIFISYAVSLSILSINYLIFSQNSVYLTSILFQFLFVCIPCFVYSSSVKDNELFRLMTERASLIVYGIGIIMGLLVFSGKMTIGTYSMSLGYYMLLPTVIFLNRFVEKFSIKYVLLFLSSVMVILSFGSRGPIMCIVLYIIIYQLVHSRKLTAKRVLLNITTLVTGMLVLFNIKWVLLNLSGYMESLGISSRSLQLFLQGKVNLSGRDGIYEEIYFQIENHPLIGIGIAGDRLYTGGMYSHNLVLEVMSGFGIVVGSILMIFFVIILIKSMFEKDTVLLNQILIWTAVGVLPLLVSSTYLTYFPFWILLGLMTRSLKAKGNLQEYDERLNKKTTGKFVAERSGNDFGNTSLSPK